MGRLMKVENVARCSPRCCIDLLHSDDHARVVHNDSARNAGTVERETML